MAAAEVYLPEPGVVESFQPNGTVCIEAEVLGFSPGGFGPQNGIAVKCVGCKEDVVRKTYGMSRDCSWDLFCPQMLGSPASLYQCSAPQQIRARDGIHSVCFKNGHSSFKRMSRTLPNMLDQIHTRQAA